MIDLITLLHNIEKNSSGILKLNPDYYKFICNDYLLDKIDSEYLFYFQKDWQFGVLKDNGELDYMVRACLKPMSVKRYLGVDRLGFPFRDDNLEHFLKTLQYKHMNVSKLRMKTLSYRKLSKAFKKRLLKNFNSLAKHILAIKAPIQVVST